MRQDPSIRNWDVFKRWLSENKITYLILFSIKLFFQHHIVVLTCKSHDRRHKHAIFHFAVFPTSECILQTTVVRSASRCLTACRGMMYSGCMHLIVCIHNGDTSLRAIRLYGYMTSGRGFVAMVVELIGKYFQNV